MSEEFANIEPVLLLRNRLSDDFNVKGFKSCPDKIDLSAIRLVYDFADHAQEDFYNHYLFGDTTIIGLTQWGYPIFNCQNFPNAREFILRNLFCVVVLSVAGRVAMVGNRVRIHLRYLYNNGANNHELGCSEWLIAAGAGLDCHLRIGKNHQGIGAAASYAPAPTDCILNIPNDPKFRNYGTDYLQIFVWSDGTFPNGSAVYIYSSTSYK